MKSLIDTARADGESLGGVFVVTATGLVPGLGTYAEGGSALGYTTRRGGRVDSRHQGLRDRGWLSLPHT